MAKIEDLYFGIRRWDWDTNELVQHNLFDYYRVKFSVARYVQITKKSKKSENDLFAIDHFFKTTEGRLRYCFGDTWGRAEWEMMVDELFGNGEHIKKMDVYEMYIVPNAKLLMKMVDDVGLNSATKWLKENELPRRH